MRWFAWLVALCLLAAGGVRPAAALTLDHHEVTVEDASDLATLAATSLLASKHQSS